MRSRRTWMLVVWALLVSLLIAIAAQGCGPQELLECPRLDGSQLYDPWCTVCAVDLSVKGCNRCLVDPVWGVSFACCQGPDGGPETCPPDAGTDSAIMDGGATGCAGDCVPAPPLGWEGPVLFSVPPDGTPLTCPSNAPVIAYQGHAGTITSDAGCTACTCAPPSGTCAPPSQITASASPCAADAGPARDFGPPPAWDGGCTAYDSIPAGALCNSAPCVVSLISGPLVVTDDTCMPSKPELMEAGPPSWSNAALACRVAGNCNDQSLQCQPTAAQAIGFFRCIFQKGDNDCPASYPDKHLAYSGFDPPGCAPCTCGASDSSCKGTLQVFEDGACSKKPVELDLSTAGPACKDLPSAGVALGSKQIALTYVPGSCAPDGGGAISPAPSGASTFCCLS